MVMRTPLDTRPGRLPRGQPGGDSAPWPCRQSRMADRSSEDLLPLPQLRPDNRGDRPAASPRSPAWPRLLVAFLALIAIALSLHRLEAAFDGVDIRREQVADIPATVFRPADAAASLPVVLIAHGFAGSQQLMQPFALTLAR